MLLLFYDKANIMRRVYFIAIITVSFLSLADRSAAQTSPSKLNQVELIKQFVSTWKGEIGKDTIVHWEIKSTGTGLDCSFKYVAKGKTIMEGKQLWGYDQKTDKFILSSTTPGMDAGPSVLWFTAKNKCTIIQYNDMSHPEKATFKLETEFKSPELFLQKAIVNDKIVKTETFNRIKN